MDTEDNRKLVEGAVARWIDGDSAAIFRLLDDNVQWTVTGTTPISRLYKSRRDFVDNALKPLAGLLEGMVKMTVLNVFADKDHVILQWDGMTT